MYDADDPARIELIRQASDRQFQLGLQKDQEAAAHRSYAHKLQMEAHQWDVAHEQRTPAGNQ